MIHRMPAAVIVVAALAAAPLAAAAESARPNVILIIADDLGSAELGCYGQEKIRTPAIDRMAREGLRFTQYYAGCPVCAPSRCVLMTGKHTGHAAIRDNREAKPEGQHPLPADETTLLEIFQRQEYVTAAMGKWGLGPPGSEGDPLKQGVDTFFGYNCQRHAHNHYPAWLYRNHDKVELEGNTGGDTGRQFSHDLFEAEALKFLREQREKPFFLYLPFVIPHVAIQVPEDSLAEYQGKWDDPPYAGGKGYRPHKHPRAAYAAMITRMDRTVGRILDLLAELKLDDRTIVLFTSDNGPTHGGVGGSDSEFFRSAGALRGLKGSVYEGGLRVPLIARWPGRIPAGRTSNLACAAYDLLPTLCAAAGLATPAKLDGISLAPTLLGREGQREHDFLYWEFPSYGGQQAVRMGDWKGVRQKLAQPKMPRSGELELFDLSRDPNEKENVAAAHPDIAEKIARIMREQHVPSPDFPLKGVDP